MALLLEKASDELLVDGVVLGHEDPRRPRRR